MLGGSTDENYLGVYSNFRQVTRLYYNLFRPCHEKRETGMIIGKCSREKHCENMLDGLKKRLNVGRVTDALRETRDIDARKVAKEHSTCLTD